MPETFEFPLLSAFDLWRDSWSRMAVPFAPPAADAAPDLPHFPKLRLELATLRLFESGAGEPGEPPTLIVAPYAVHDAAIADFAPGHSLAEALLGAGAGPLALAAWKSAGPEMRDFGIDVYLSDLNVAIDDLGGRVALIGLCQGGWLAALYAARFPAKVATLALAGAPVDLGAAASGITRALALAPPSLIEGAIAFSGGRVMGAVSLVLWMPGIEGEYQAAAALQAAPDAALKAKFETWNAATLNLPGRYFVETTEWLFRENRLAENRFPALGRLCGLGDITAPVFVLAARKDSVVALEQATGAQARCVNAPVETRVAEGGHLSLFMGARTLAEHWPAVARWQRQHRGRRRH